MDENQKNRTDESLMDDKAQENENNKASFDEKPKDERSEFLKYVPGFRSNKRWKKIVSILYYILFSITAIANKSMGIFLSGIALPFFIFSIIDLIKSRENNISKKPIVIVLVISLICMTIGANLNKDIASGSIGAKEDKKLELDFDIKSELSDNNKVKVTIETNLPDDTELLVTLEGVSAGYKGQDKISVSNGKAETEWFSNKGSSLKAATYYITVSTPITDVQPKKVQRVVGENYENVTSNLMVDSDSGKKIIKDFKTINIKNKYSKNTTKNYTTAKDTVDEDIESKDTKNEDTTDESAIQYDDNYSDEQEYIDFITEQSTKFSGILRDFSDTMSAPTFTDEWALQTAAILTQMNHEADITLEYKNVPSKFKDVNYDYTEAMKRYKRVANELPEAIDNMDVNKINELTEVMEDGNLYIESATQTILNMTR